MFGALKQIKCTCGKCAKNKSSYSENDWTDDFVSVYKCECGISFHITYYYWGESKIQQSIYGLSPKKDYAYKEEAESYMEKFNATS